MDTKQKLISLVSALQEENIVDYCYTFIGLKVYGKALLPDSITADLRQLWEEHFNLPHEEQQEQTAEGKQAGEYRCSIVKMLYDIENEAVLNYIRIIVEDVAKEAKGGAHMPNERKEVVSELLNEVEGIRNIAIVRFLLNVTKSFKRKWEGAI